MQRGGGRPPASPFPFPFHRTPAMRNVLKSAFGAFLSPILFAAGLQAQIEGTWTAGPRDDGRVQLGIDVDGSNWSSGFPRADLQGLTEAQRASPASTPVEFRIVREAGTFRMDGSFRGGRGSGHFRFVPDRGFTRALGALGVGGAARATDRELMNLALAGTTVAMVRDFRALGFGELSMRDVFELSVHGVTPEYVREMRALGLAGTNTVRGITRLKIHRITRDFVRELESVGFRDLDRSQLLQMGIHGVSAAGVRELRALGYTDLTPRQVLQMRIHGVTPAFIRELREAGFSDLPPETLVRMRIHGIDASFVRGARGR